MNLNLESPSVELSQWKEKNFDNSLKNQAADIRIAAYIGAIFLTLASPIIVSICLTGGLGFTATLLIGGSVAALAILLFDMHQFTKVYLEKVRDLEGLEKLEERPEDTEELFHQFLDPYKQLKKGELSEIELQNDIDEMFANTAVLQHLRRLSIALSEAE